MRKEFLFNILMDYEIPFLTNKSKTIFILLDEKIIISSKEISEDIEYLFTKQNYKIIIKSNGKIESLLLSTILMIPEIYINFDIIEI